MTPVRLIKAEELPAVLDLLKDSGLPYEDIDTDRISGFLVATGGQALLGAVGMEMYGKDALLRSLVVRPESRCTGLGDQLVKAMEQRAGQMGIVRLYLLTTTAEPFFTRRGYKRIARADAPGALQATAQFAGLCPSQAVCMLRNLNE